jgi:hypothetical protein
MKCHYEKIKGVGKVLIPGCMAVAVSNDIERCTCHNTTYESFERKRYNIEIKRFRSESSSSELELGLNELGNEGWEVIKMEIFNERALCVAKRKRR